MGVDIPGRYAQNNCGDSLPISLNGKGVRAAGMSHGNLMIDVVFLCRLNDELGQFWMANRRWVEQANLDAIAGHALGRFEIRSGEIVSRRTLQNNGNIRIGCCHRYFSAPDADFFLDTAHADDGIGMIDAGHPLHGLDDQSAAAAVVKGLGREHLWVRHGHEKCVRCDRLTRPNAQFVHCFFLAGCTDVQEHVLYL